MTDPADATPVKTLESWAVFGAGDDVNKLPPNGELFRMPQNQRLLEKFGLISYPISMFTPKTRTAISSTQSHEVSRVSTMLVFSEVSPTPWEPTSFVFKGYDPYSRWTNYSNPGQLYPPRPPNFKVVVFFQGLRRVDKTNQTPQHDISRTHSLTLTFGEGGVFQSFPRGLNILSIYGPGR